MNGQRLFSVIIPSFNRAGLLGTALDSVLEQTFNDFEVIVVDDGSSDNTPELLSSYKDDRLNVIRQDNLGVSCARNRGISASSGRYIAFLDSDDSWTGQKLERAGEYIEMFPMIPVFHTEEIWYRRGKRLNQKDKHRKPSGNIYRAALPLCCISISTAVVKRDLFDLVGLFDEELEACEDYDFWLRATSRSEVKLIPEELTVKDGGRPDQLSSSVWGLDRFRIKALEKMISSGGLGTDDLNATIDELDRKCRIFASGAEKRGKFKEAEHYRRLADKYSRTEDHGQQRSVSCEFSAMCRRITPCRPATDLTPDSNQECV